MQFTDILQRIFKKGRMQLVDKDRDLISYCNTDLSWTARVWYQGEIRLLKVSQPKGFSALRREIIHTCMLQSLGYKIPFAYRQIFTYGYVTDEVGFFVGEYFNEPDGGGILLDLAEQGVITQCHLGSVLHQIRLWQAADKSVARAQVREIMKLFPETAADWQQKLLHKATSIKDFLDIKGLWSTLQEFVHSSVVVQAIDSGAGKIRLCHGDLKAGNVFLQNPRHAILFDVEDMNVSPNSVIAPSYDIGRLYVSLADYPHLQEMLRKEWHSQWCLFDPDVVLRVGILHWTVHNLAWYVPRHESYKDAIGAQCEMLNFACK